MSNAGQAVLGIVGGVIGFVVGGPTGAAYGFQLGYLAGTALFPTQLPHMQGPRLGDGQNTTSTVGQPIPRIFGTQTVGGNVIWASPIREVANTETQGGKGAPEQSVTTYTYYRSWAILLCEGPIGGVRRVWANGKIIFDKSVPPIVVPDPDDYEQYGQVIAALIAQIAANDKYAGKMNIYLGTEDQMPDPVIESFEGAGNVPAFRGYAYIVFDDIELQAEDGNRMPGSWKIEVFEEADEEAFDAEQYSNEVIYDWIPNSKSKVTPENPFNDHEYSMVGYASTEVGASVGGPFRGTIEATYQDFEDVTGYPVNDPYKMAWSISLGDENNVAADHYTGDIRPWGPDPSNIPNNREYAFLHIGTAISNGGTGFNGFHPRITFFSQVTNEGYNLAANQLIGNQPNAVDYVWWTGKYSGVGDPAWETIETSMETGLYWWAHPDTIVRFDDREQVADNVTLLPPGFGTPEGVIKVLYDIIVQVRRVPSPPPDPADVGLFTGIPGWYVVAGQLMREGAWTFDDSTTYRVLREHSVSGTPALTTYPLNPCRPLGHPQYDSEAFWTAAYEAEVVRGRMPAGLTYGVDYPATQDFGYKKTNVLDVFDTQPVSLASIVGRLCDSVGLDSYDVTDLENRFVVGYQVSRPMAARAAIEPLRSVGFFDCVESAIALKFPTRGKAAVATLTDGDIGCFFSDEQRPPAITTKKLQEFEMPRQVRVHYQNPERDFDPGEELSPVRFDTRAESVVDVDLAVAISSTEAARIAEVLYRDFWASRWAHATSVDQSWAFLEAADCVIVPVDGRDERMRIPAYTDRLPNLRALELVRDDDGSYVSTATGSTSVRVPDRLPYYGPVETHLMDLPPLSDEHDDAGFYAAVRPAIIDGSFRGAVISRSADGGAYAIVGSLTSAAPSGVLSSAPPSDPPTTIFDEGSEMLVDIMYGELESRTEGDVIDGANAAAVGADGRWCIVQFKNAEFVSGTLWRLTGLLWGRKGTEHAIDTLEQGDAFVMISTGAVARIPLQVAEISLSRLYKGTPVGTSPELVEPVSFAGRGVALKPFSPVHLHGERDDDGSVSIEWTRRDRFAAVDSVPMSESVEDYEVDVYSGDDVIRTISVSQPETVYSAEQQVLDFGALQAEIRVSIYQISETVGRGYPLEGTI